MIKPLHDKVLIAQVDYEKATESGIVIESAKGLGNTQKAKVLAIGPDVLDVKVDDYIYVDWAKATPVKVDGAQRAFVKEEFIIGVIEGV